MSANSKSILFQVKLPNELFWAFVEIAKSMGDTRATIARKLIREYVKKNRTVLQKHYRND